MRIQWNRSCDLRAHTYTIYLCYDACAISAVVPLELAARVPNDELESLQGQLYIVYVRIFEALLAHKAVQWGFHMTELHSPTQMRACMFVFVCLWRNNTPLIWLAMSAFCHMIRRIYLWHALPIIFVWFIAVLLCERRWQRQYQCNSIWFMPISVHGKIFSTSFWMIDS